MHPTPLDLPWQLYPEGMLHLLFTVLTLLTSIIMLPFQLFFLGMSI